MSWKVFTSDTTSIEGPLRIPVPPPYAPYAEAWKEFDRLEQSVNRRGPYQWVFRIVDFFLFGGAGLFGISIWKHHKSAAILTLVVLSALDYAIISIIRNRFRDWPCPRCHSVWPGTKKEKDPACKVCGLRLHQMAP